MVPQSLNRPTAHVTGWRERRENTGDEDFAKARKMLINHGAYPPGLCISPDEGDEGLVGCLDLPGSKEWNVHK